MKDVRVPDYRGARCGQVPGCRSCKTLELEYWPDALGHAQHHHHPDNIRRRCTPSCGRTLQCGKCQAFGSGAGLSWLRSAASRPAALNARGRRPGGSRRSTLNRPAKRGSVARALLASLQQGEYMHGRRANTRLAYTFYWVEHGPAGSARTTYSNYSGHVRPAPQGPLTPPSPAPWS